MTTYSYTSNNRRVELRFTRDLGLLEGQYVIADLFVSGKRVDTFEGYTIAEAIEEAGREYPDDLFFKMVETASTVLSVTPATCVCGCALDADGKCPLELDAAALSLVEPAVSDDDTERLPRVFPDEVFMPDDYVPMDHVDFDIDSWW